MPLLTPTTVISCGPSLCLTRDKYLLNIFMFAKLNCVILFEFFFMRSIVIIITIIMMMIIIIMVEIYVPMDLFSLIYPDQLGIVVELAFCIRPH